MTDPPVDQLAQFHPATPVIIRCAEERGAKVFTFDADAYCSALEDAGWLVTDQLLRTVRADALRDAAVIAPDCAPQLLARADALDAGAGPVITHGPRGRHRAN